MKLKFRELIIGTALCTVLTFSSCKEDNDFKFSYDDSNDTELISGARDITNGMSHIMVDIDNLSEKLFSLGTRKNVTVSIDNEADFPLLWELKRDEEGFNHVYIKGVKETRSSMEEGAVLPFIMKVSTADESQSKDVRIVVRKKLNVGTGYEAVKKTYYYEKIGRSLFPWSGYGDTYTVILEPDYLPLELGGASQSSLEWEIGGTRIEETLEEFSAHIGLNFKGPNGKLVTRDAVLNGGIDVGVKGSASQSKNCEYYMGYVAKVMDSARIPILDQDKMFEDIKEDGTPLLADYLNSNVNDALNNNGTDDYNRYDNNDPESIYQLLDAVGTHVLMSATFGGSYIHTYCRMELAYDRSIGVDASADIRASEKSGELEDFIDVWKAKNGKYLDAKADVSYYSEEYKAASYVFSGNYVRGGNKNSGNIDIWDQSFSADDCSGWEITRYMANDMDSETGRNIIPIYEFITDADRKKAVMNNFDDYVENRMNKLHPAKEDWTLVLADLMMVYDSHGGHSKGHGESFCAVGPDNNTYLYQPIMANKKFPEQSDWGHPLETCQSHYTGLAANTGAHYWYYALGYYHKEWDNDLKKMVNKGTLGFTDARFLDAKQDKDFFDSEVKLDHNWVRRGDHSNESIWWELNNNYVYLLPANNETEVEDLVKGVALRERGFHKSSGTIIGSSGGAEWQYPFNDSDQDKIDDYFSSWIWQGNTDFENRLFYETTNSPHDTDPVYVYIILGLSKDILPVQTQGLNWGVGGDHRAIQNPYPWGQDLY